MSRVWPGGRFATSAAARAASSSLKTSSSNITGVVPVSSVTTSWPARRNAKCERALLALRRLRARLEPVDLEPEFVAVRADKGDAAILFGFGSPFDGVAKLGLDPRPRRRRFEQTLAPLRGVVHLDGTRRRRSAW